MEQFLALYALMGFLDLLGLLVCFLPLFRTLWFGMEDYRLVVYRGWLHTRGAIIMPGTGFFYLVFSGLASQPRVQ
jgi:hypothetical protein